MRKIEKVIAEKRCPCGGVILADTEDCKTPLCYDCAQDIKCSVEDNLYSLGCLCALIRTKKFQFELMKEGCRPSSVEFLETAMGEIARDVMERAMFGNTKEKCGENDNG